MRRLKFRIWDKEAKRYSGITDFPLICLSGKIACNNGIKDIHQTDYILEQYTGFTKCYKEKPDIDMYENDVINVIGKNHKVVFRFGSFGIKGNDGFVSLLELCENGYSIDIVGNIHDNPDLLSG